MSAVTINFSVHWAMNARNSKKDASGRSVLTRVCLGILCCTKDGCCGIVRPKTKQKDLDLQLQNGRCPIPTCKSVLRHITCKAQCQIRKNHDGSTTFVHRGHHSHICPPTLHQNPDIASRFRDIIESNPHRTPVQLLTGSSLEGAGQSVTKLDPSLANLDRLAYRRRDVQNGGAQSRRGGDRFVDALASFMREHPHFIIFVQFFPTVLIVMQTNYMASFMVQELRQNDNRHGFVTDANHGFFASDKKYLFVTSTFSVMHEGWVPVFLAYSGGQAEQDYRVYFFELFKSMHRWFGTASDITDEDYAQVYHTLFVAYFVPSD
jgi:hypothetical protein